MASSELVAVGKHGKKYFPTNSDPAPIAEGNRNYDLEINEYVTARFYPGSRPAFLRGFPPPNLLISIGH